MDELKQNKLIAEELSKRGAIVFDVSHEDLMFYQPDGLAMRSTRSFTRSLDSCRLFEETLGDEERIEYYEEWVAIVIRNNGDYKGEFQIRKALFATPAQRCEAFLRTLNLWQEAL